MLYLENYVPIDKEKVKEHWNKIINVPNNQWELLEIEEKIDVINNKELPSTLRTIKLNLLPYLVIEAIDSDIKELKRKQTKTDLLKALSNKTVKQDFKERLVKAIENKNFKEIKTQL